jgi:MHS family shikimate/dehydroshikimate transporter-like MFS transporter
MSARRRRPSLGGAGRIRAFRRVRYSGASLGYQLASVFAGGFAPLVAAALLKAWSWPAVALYMAVMALITVVATWFTTETYQSDIHADDVREQELVGPDAATGARG